MTLLTSLAQDAAAGDKGVPAETHFWVVRLWRNATMECNAGSVMQVSSNPLSFRFVADGQVDVLEVPEVEQSVEVTEVPLFAILGEGACEGLLLRCATVQSIRLFHCEWRVGA